MRPPGCLRRLNCIVCSSINKCLSGQDRYRLGDNWFKHPRWVTSLNSLDQEEYSALQHVRISTQMIGNPGSILTVSSGRIAPLLNPLTPLRLFLFLIGVSLYPRLILHNYLLWGGLDDKMSSEIDPEKGVEKKKENASFKSFSRSTPVDYQSGYASTRSTSADSWHTPLSISHVFC